MATDPNRTARGWPWILDGLERLARRDGLDVAMDAFDEGATHTPLVMLWRTWVKRELEKRLAATPPPIPQVFLDAFAE